MSADPVKVPRSEAFRYWWTLGWTSFGGPAGQIAMMHAEVVERRRWLSEGRFLHALNYTMALPGPEAQQLAIYIGWLLHGRWGGIVAGSLFVLPSLALMIVAGWAYLAFGHLPAVDALLWGVKPVVVAIVAAAAWRIGRRVLRGAGPAVVAAAAFVAMAMFDVPFPAVIATAALAGAVFAGRRGWPSPAVSAPAPTVAGQGGQVRGVIGTAAVGIGLWLIAMAALYAATGGGLLVELGGFFTKVALVTFGGAYAVLPYVYQAAVAEHGWVTTAQMIDGLALGESTPGPLIMVVVFVGYVAGATADDAALGVLAALVVAFFTFLPSFLFILVGAPLIEATRDERRLTRPLAGITAAVVGVILNLAVFFGAAVFVRPDGVDWAALAVAGVAAVALFSGRVGVVAAVLAGAAIGLVFQMVA